MGIRNRKTRVAWYRILYFCIGKLIVDRVIFFYLYNKRQNHRTYNNKRICLILRNAASIAISRAVNFQIDLRGCQWKTIWFTSGGQFERFLSSVFVGCSKVTDKIILDPAHILKFGEWHAISFLCMHVHTKRYWKVLSRVVAINFVQNAQWRNRK